MTSRGDADSYTGIYLPFYLLGEATLALLSAAKFKPKWIPDPAEGGRNLAEQHFVCNFA